MRSEIEQLIEVVGLQETINVCRVHRTTVGRWIKGQVKPPASALVTLRLLAWGKHPREDRAWEGWIFRRGKLVSPDGDEFEPGDVKALRYLHPLVKSQRKRIEELEAQIVALTREVARADPAANDLAVWPGDPRTKAYG